MSDFYPKHSYILLNIFRSCIDTAICVHSLISAVALGCRNFRRPPIFLCIIFSHILSIICPGYILLLLILCTIYVMISVVERVSFSVLLQL